MKSRTGAVLRCHGPGQQVKAEELEVVAGPDETLVEMRLAAVTQADRSVLTGKQPTQPFVLGSEGVGVVVASSVLEAGTPVVIRGEGVGVTRPGLWGRYAVVPDAAVHRLPAGLDPAAALALLTPALTAHTAVRRVAGVLEGETVVITGITSLVGCLSAAVARSAGAAKVIGLARLGESVDVVAPLVDQIVRVDELGQIGRELPWCDAAIDTVGGPVTSGVLGHITPGGRVAVLGYKAGEFTTIDLHQLIGRDLRILPVNVQRTVIEPGAVSQALADVAPAQLSPPVDVLPADRVGDALDRSAADRRVLLDLTAF
ncbi:NADPH:quinone reductase-like Zn-dependent oxidoreductase [Kribbella steppae]|uniref:NADPH:quinone reductase-like Zn-dependent oxidoreductase n=1 Tax=Kribbella steppae TaxID=2512223 RepID=A0A4R2H8L3_9ACTN|nr:alcohol dehydrogenase catalytic domain-containing protein [Kribbella steppae]TCO23258.1 NADPH:quinone reductase-like Zn-dependent oxidoreductase [Kribbella steppae]